MFSIRVKHTKQVRMVKEASEKILIIFIEVDIVMKEMDQQISE